MQPTPDPDVVTAYEHETWSRCAATYVDSFAELTSATIEPLLDAAVVSAGSRVLDLGTGPGLVAAAIRSRQGIPIGIDFAESMVSEARRRYPDIEFREANAESLPFADGAFDAVVGNFVFHHLARPDRVLAEAHRVVRDSGKIALTAWADPSKLAAFGRRAKIGICDCADPRRSHIGRLGPALASSTNPCASRNLERRR